jgi:hypothetical protein
MKNAAPTTYAAPTTLTYAKPAAIAKPAAEVFLPEPEIHTDPIPEVPAPPEFLEEIPVATGRRIASVPMHAENLPEFVHSKEEHTAEEIAARVALLSHGRQDDAVVEEVILVPKSATGRKASSLPQGALEVSTKKKPLCSCMAGIKK